MYGVLPICQNSHDRHSARAAGSVGRNSPNFSARYIKIAPVSKTRIGLGPLRSTKAGILEFGFAATKPLPNWSPSPILMSQASYSAPLWPIASSSSSMIVTLTPFGVPSEYSCNGWRPTGNSLSWVEPAIGRLMLANLPPLGLFQAQTLGGV